MTQTNPKQQEVFRLLEELEIMCDEGRKEYLIGPAVVSVKDLREIVDNMKGHLGEALEESDRILQKRDTILEQAQSEGQRIVESHQAQIAQQPVLREAEKKARELLMRTNQKSNEIKREAESFKKDMLNNSYAFVDGLFTETEVTLREKTQEAQDEISKGRKEMRNFFLKNQEKEDDDENKQAQA